MVPGSVRCRTCCLLYITLHYTVITRPLTRVSCLNSENLVICLRHNVPLNERTVGDQISLCRAISNTAWFTNISRIVDHLRTAFLNAHSFLKRLILQRRDISLKKKLSHGVAMLIAWGSRVSSPGTRYARRTASEDNNNNNNYRDTERRVAANPQTRLWVCRKLAATIHIHHRHRYYYSARKLILILPSREGGRLSRPYRVAMALCLSETVSLYVYLSVCLSVTSRSSTETVERIGLALMWELPSTYPTLC